ncbi:MAG TPA: hypothetical protein VF427_13695 [Noviherbaspirillum sp.]
MAERAESGQAQPSSTGLHVRGVLWGGIAIAGCTVLAAVVSYLLWQRWNTPPVPEPQTLPALANPLLQSAPQPERAQYFAEKNRLLESWEWIDRQRGIARIPVEQAMRIIAERHRNTLAAPTEPMESR